MKKLIRKIILFGMTLFGMFVMFIAPLILFFQIYCLWEFFTYALRLIKYGNKGGMFHHNIEMMFIYFMILTISGFSIKFSKNKR